MTYSVLADTVAAAHLVFVGFCAVGGFVALRYPWLLLLHIPAVGWMLGIVAGAWPCPLTGLERTLRQRAGEPPFEEGFVDRYLTGVVYPAGYEWLAQAVLVIAMVGSWVLIARRRLHGPSRLTP